MIDMDEERAAMRVIAFLATLAVAFAAFVAALIISGCASLTQDEIARLDAIFWEWVADREAKGDKPPSAEPMPDTPPPQTPPATDPSDAVPYDSLQWRYGGFNGAKARLDAPRISGLSLRNGNRVYYKWDVGLGAWGLAHSDPGAICAIFFERNGAWAGGKFDWVSTSRSDRELKHVQSYNNWPSSGIKLPWNGRVAFVVVSADGKRRSNVLVAKAQ